MNGPPAFVMETISDLWDHIAYVMEYAPSDFPREDHLLPEQQMNLEMAFEQLRQGIEVAYPAADGRWVQLDALLDRALVEYRNGDKTVAAGMLAEFESIIFEPDGRLRGAN